jgi:hypothetical protein
MLHLLLGPRGGPRIEDKEFLYERQQVSARGKHLTKDPWRGVQDLATYKLPEGLAELPSTRGIT